MTQSDSQAQNSIGETHKTAVIKLLDPEDYDEDFFDEPQDHERSLVHELLHLHTTYFEPGQDDDLKDTMHEQAICLIADGLVRLKRGEG